MTVNSEHHVLGLWIGGGVTPSALRELDTLIRGRAHAIEPGPLRTELLDMANACHAQLTKLPKPECDLI